MSFRSASLPLVLLLCAVLSEPGGARVLQVAPQAPGSTAPLVVEVRVLDAAGRAVPGIAAEDLDVRLDGQPRRVLSVSPLAASGRLALLVIDEGSYPPTFDKQVKATAAHMAAALESDARIAVLTLPLPSPRISFTTDRAALSREIERIAGRGAGEAMPTEVGDRARAVSDPQAADPTGRPRAVAPTERAAQQSREPDAAAAHADALLDPLERVLTSLRSTPGPKVVILLSAGSAAGPGPTSVAEWRAALAAVANAAVSARAIVDVVTLPSMRDAADRAQWLEELAAATGGTVFDGRRDAEGAGRLLAQARAATLTIEIEAQAADGDGRTHPLSVASPTGKGHVVSPQRVLGPAGLPRAAATGAAPAPPSPVPVPAPAAAPPPAAPAPSARATRGPDQELEGVLALAATYFADYEKALSSVVAEEDYLQRYSRPLSVVSNLGGDVPPGTDYAVRERRLKSDFLLVQTSTVSGWIPFRDVFEVDGKGVRDREERLKKLFLDAPATAVSQANVIMKESARYNLGDLARTINIPTLPLLLIDVRNRDRFAWKRGGDQTVEGVRTRRLEFEELARPTLIHSSQGEDVPIAGTLWIDPMSGRLVKGRIRSGRQTITMEMTVIFRPNDSLGVWVPAQMEELYKVRGQTIEGTARYANFRRFQVQTEETIRIPKLDDDRAAISRHPQA